MEVHILYESARECGYRKPDAEGAGIYLIGPASFEPCERLPFPLESCPCCGGGVKPSRSYTWINPIRLLDPCEFPACCEITGVEKPELKHNHANCYMCNPAKAAGDRAGLIWIGHKHYKTSDEFMREAKMMGISRKIGALPLGFEVGRTVVYLAHRRTWNLHALQESNQSSDAWAQGIFSAFRPVGIDIVINDPDKVPQRAIDLAKKVGSKARIVKVIPIDDTEGAAGDEW